MTTKKPILVFGAEERGKVVVDILQKNGFFLYGFLDDDPVLHGKAYHHLPVLNDLKSLDALSLSQEDCLFFIAFTDREKYLNAWEFLLAKGREQQLVNAIHPRAVLAEQIDLGRGICIEAGASVGPGTMVHAHCHIGAQVVLGSSVLLEDFVAIEAGAIIGEKVLVGKNAYIGAGAIIGPGVRIASGQRIAPGQVICRERV